MRFSRNSKKFITAMTLFGFTLGVTGCAPESTTSTGTSGSTSGTAKQANSGPKTEQAGSTTGHGAEVPAPADAKDDGEGAKE
jgi:hypothetical protein